MKRPTRRSMIVIVAAVLALVVTTGVWATGLESAANQGKAEAQAGVTRLASMDATGAASQFDAAKRSFSRAQGMMGPEWFGTAVGAVPLVGRQYSTALSLVAIGLAGSTAGAEVAAVLLEAPAGRTETTSTSGSGSLLEARLRHVDAAFTALGDAADRAALLDEDGLVPPLAKAVVSIKAALGDVGPVLGRVRALLPLEKYLLSSTRRILVISQDGAELRPTGGFPGSYGIVEVGPTGVRLQEYRDIYVLPDPPGRVVPPPGALFTDNFRFRDANWWIDYPTSARYMLEYWRDSRQPPVDGIVAIDTVAMKYLLEALGPVRVPSYAETFTAENLLPRLLYYTQLTARGRKDRKGVLVALATEVERRVLDSSPGDLAKAASALAKAADAKHVQLYFTDPTAQAAVVELGWSGRIAPPGGTTDMLVISNAMNRGDKINMAMRKTIDYRVALKPDRSAESTLALGYANTEPFMLTSRGLFRDWLRVYRAPGTTFVPGDAGYDTVELGLPTAIRTFAVHRGRTRTETIVSRVAAAWRVGGVSSDPVSPTQNDGSSFWVPSGASRYRLFIVKQADLEDIPTTVSVAPPPGWRVSAVSARLVASGEALPATNDGGRARLAVPLSGDVVLDVWMAPS